MRSDKCGVCQLPSEQLKVKHGHTSHFARDIRTDGAVCYSEAILVYEGLKLIPRESNSYLLRRTVPSVARVASFRVRDRGGLLPANAFPWNSRARIPLGTARRTARCSRREKGSLEFFWRALNKVRAIEGASSRSTEKRKPCTGRRSQSTESHRGISAVKGKKKSIARNFSPTARSTNLHVSWNSIDWVNNKINFELDSRRLMSKRYSQNPRERNFHLHWCLIWIRKTPLRIWQSLGNSTDLKRD